MRFFTLPTVQVVSLGKCKCFNYLRMKVAPKHLFSVFSSYFLVWSDGVVCLQILDLEGWDLTYNKLYIIFPFHTTYIYVLKCLAKRGLCETVSPNNVK
jgi:hypothetical protein